MRISWLTLAKNSLLASDALLRRFLGLLQLGGRPLVLGDLLVEPIEAPLNLRGHRIELMVEDPQFVANRHRGADLEVAVAELGYGPGEPLDPRDHVSAEPPPRDSDDHETQDRPAHEPLLGYRQQLLDLPPFGVDRGHPCAAETLDRLEQGMQMAILAVDVVQEGLVACQPSRLHVLGEVHEALPMTADRLTPAVYLALLPLRQRRSGELPKERLQPCLRRPVLVERLAPQGGGIPNQPEAILEAVGQQHLPDNLTGQRALVRVEIDRSVRGRGELPLQPLGPERRPQHHAQRHHQQQADLPLEAESRRKGQTGPY